MESPNSDSYIAVAILITMGTAMFVDPGKGKVQKWIYWCVSPILIIGLSSFVFGSVLGGLAIGSALVIFLGLSYLRYNL